MWSVCDEASDNVNSGGAGVEARHRRRPQSGLDRFCSAPAFGHPLSNRPSFSDLIAIERARPEPASNL